MSRKGLIKDDVGAFFGLLGTTLYFIHNDTHLSSAEVTHRAAWKRAYNAWVRAEGAWHCSYPDDAPCIWCGKIYKRHYRRAIISKDYSLKADIIRIFKPNYGLQKNYIISGPCAGLKLYFAPNPELAQKRQLQRAWGKQS